MPLFAELNRHIVICMALLYALISRLLLKVADVQFDPFEVPQGAFRTAPGLLISGFPMALHSPGFRLE
jgi:hypothetical protein